MTEIIVAPHNGKWAAFIEGKPVVKSPCKSCIIHALSIYTRNNRNKYSAIIIKDETGQITETIQIGASGGR